MLIVSVSAAKRRLVELIRLAQQGEEILITRHGKPIVRLSAIEQPKCAIVSRKAFRARLPGWSEDSASLVRAVREESR